ncbi:MAG: hypothetical protein GXP25_22865 [Planctomycetes bacterium]|nr:hypothetical protein [Planctomycetota bacterium]
MAAGNRSVLVVVDSRRPAERARVAWTVFAALDHFGVPYEVIEGGDYWKLPPGHVAPRAAYILSHDGAGACLKPDVAEEMAKAVKAGAGILIFDRETKSWPPALRALLPSGAKMAQTDVLRVAVSHFITSGHEPDEEIALNCPIDVLTLPVGHGLGVLVTTADGSSAIVKSQVDDGRVVLFGTGDEIYAEGVLGHLRGIDGLMWRALVWAAAKPLPMRCIPPFVTARMDDCNGTYGAFAYVNVLNRHGISPNLGLFIDEMGPTDWANAKELFDKGGADFSMHAFRDDFYKANPKYKPYAILPDKPDLSNGGKETAFEGLSLDHITGRDLGGAAIKRNFERMDDAFAKAGIRHSRIINAHFGEIGWRAVPRFLARGVDLSTNNSVVGQLYGMQPLWRPRPYGVRGPNGRAGLVIDRCPQHPGLMFVGMSPSHLGRTHMVTDILSGHVPFLTEAEAPKLREAADRAIANVKLGLDSLAYGVIMTHEERIDAISLDDWETVVNWTMKGLADCDFEPTGREHVSVIVKRLFDSALVHANVTDNVIHCELCGRTDGPSPLTIWENEGDGCKRRRVEVGQFDGFQATTVT